MEYKSFFSEAGGAEGTRCNYPTRLDTYGRGCQHDCSYCYAKSLLSFRGLWNAESPSKADLRKVLHKVSEIPKGSVIRLGGMTDCFMAMEAEHHVTYETIKAMNRRGIHQLIVTKSPLISTDEYLEILDPELAHIQISITSTDEELSRKYEKAPSPIARMRSAEKLSELGFDVSLRLSPYLAQYVDLEVLGGVNVDKLLVEFLRVNHWVEKWFSEYDFSEYTFKQGGYRHLHLSKKMELLKPLKKMFKQVSVCEDVDEHYQHFQAFINANYNDCCNLRL